MKFLSQFLFISAYSLLQGVQAEAQEPTKSLPKTKVVLRISRQFIRELTGKQFERNEPIAKYSNGATVQGCAHAEGTFDVKLQKSANDIDFDFLVKGEVSTQVVATRRLVQVLGHGVAGFTGRQRVVFDGNAFTGQSVEINATYHYSLDRACSFRGGLSGSLTRGIALRTARRNLPEYEQEALPAWQPSFRDDALDAFRPRWWEAARGVPETLSDMRAESGGASAAMVGGRSAGTD